MSRSSLLTLLMALSLTACVNANRIASYKISSINGTTYIPATETRVMLGTRWATSGVIEDIFGASTVVQTKSGGVQVKVSDITRSQIVDQPVSWGGSCDPYQTVYLEPRESGFAVWPELPVGYKPGPKECVEKKTSKE